MAKVKGPLFSVTASGKIADTLVYFPWKGIRAVRQWLVPSDPKSPAQVTQRGHLRDAVAEFHAARYTAYDREAWNRYASHDPSIMTGFNRMVKSYLTVVALPGRTWFRLRDAVTSAITATGFTVTISTDEPSPLIVTIAWGLTPGTLLNSAPMDALTAPPSTDWEYDITGLTGKTIYYYQIRVNDVNSGGETGIYDVRTA